MTASQVQRRFPNFLPSGRTARRHLAELQESLGYLDLAPTPSPLWPKVYALSRKGLKKLQTTSVNTGSPWQPSVLDRRRTHGYSALHVLHELLITEFLLELKGFVETQSNLELLTTERRSLSRHSAFQVGHNDSAQRLVPDAYFVVRRKAAGLLGTFLEIDTGSMSLRQIRQKLRRYADWKQTSRAQAFLEDSFRTLGAQKPRPVFRVIMICAGKPGINVRKRAKAINGLAQGIAAQIADHFWVVPWDGVGTTQNLLNRFFHNRHDEIIACLC